MVIPSELSDGNYPFTAGTSLVYRGASARDRVRLEIKNGIPTFMRASDDANKCVAFIGYLLPNGDVALAGTVFFLIRPLNFPNSNLCYAVTARHVIQGIESMGQTTCVIRMNTHRGSAVNVEIPIESWWFHPDESEVDVAATIFALDPQHDFLGIFVDNLVTDPPNPIHDIGIGDEVYLAGLFANRAGKEKNIPIIRVGNIAAMPDPKERILTRMGFMEAYLIEVRSLGGLSGAPVFVNLGLLRKMGGQFAYSTLPHGTAYMIGLMHGHYDMEVIAPNEGDQARKAVERINKGIGIVVPSHKILEVLNQPMVKEFEQKVEQGLRERELPTADSLVTETEPFTREVFEDALKRASRRVSQPDEEKKET